MSLLHKGAILQRAEWQQKPANLLSLPRVDTLSALFLFLHICFIDVAFIISQDNSILALRLEALFTLCPPPKKTGVAADEFFFVFSLPSPPKTKSGMAADEFFFYFFLSHPLKKSGMAADEFFSPIFSFPAPKKIRNGCG